MRHDHDLAFLLQYENVAWYEEGAVRILDRRVYPMEVRFVTCTRHQEVAQAIADMVTQSGGPFAAAAMGMALAAYECRGRPGAEQRAFLSSAAHTLAHARPTTAARMKEITGDCLRTAEAALVGGEDVTQAVFQHALAMQEEKYARYEVVGRLLAGQFPAHGAVMTQCFGETVVGMMLRACRETGKDVRFFCPETRPYFQGARLTASCIRDMEFPVTVITDNMPAWAMAQGRVDLFTSAADVICGDGHVVNKVGTLQIALAAKQFGVPYYVTGSPSAAHPTADSITIESRDPTLVLEPLGIRTVLPGVEGWYPAFDITPPELVTGVVTHRGIFPPDGLATFFTT